MIKQAMLKEIEYEGQQTKKMLERVPFDKFDWKPHDKSRPLGKLATHVAEIPRWTSRILSSSEFDFATFKPTPSEINSTNDLVKLSEDILQKALSDLQAASDEELMSIWTAKRGEQIFFQLPKAAAIRSFAMNHLVHHRGQLSVYLRLLDIPVPGMYGPSADEM